MKRILGLAAAALLLACVEGAPPDGGVDAGEPSCVERCTECMPVTTDCEAVCTVRSVCIESATDCLGVQACIEGTDGGR